MPFLRSAQAALSATPRPQNLDAGRRMADLWFESRMPTSGPRAGMKNVETHLSERQLALLLALAFQAGARAQFEALAPRSFTVDPQE